MNGSSGVRVRQVESDRARLLPLLLEADPDASMIARYLERGEVFVIEERGEAVAVAVVTREEPDAVCELKNLAVRADCRGRGLARALVEWLCRRYAAGYACMVVGTAENGVELYQKLGFAPSHRVKNFFVDNYPEPVMDNGARCVDMIYLRRALRPDGERMAPASGSG